VDEVLAAVDTGEGSIGVGHEKPPGRVVAGWLRLGPRLRRHRGISAVQPAPRDPGAEPESQVGAQPVNAPGGYIACSKPSVR
jgi:hypothetical protein